MQLTELHASRNSLADWFQFTFLIRPDITVLVEWVWNTNLLTFTFWTGFFPDKTSMRRLDMDKIFVHLPLFQKQGFWIVWHQKSLSKSQLHRIGCGITFSTVPFLSATCPKRNLALFHFCRQHVPREISSKSYLHNMSQEKSHSKSYLHNMSQENLTLKATYTTCPKRNLTLKATYTTCPKRNLTLKATDAEQNGGITFNCSTSEATCPKKSDSKSYLHSIGWGNYFQHCSISVGNMSQKVWL